MMGRLGRRPSMGLVVHDRASASIVAAALVEVATGLDPGSVIDRRWGAAGWASPGLA
ncbi:hypothetical protein [[Mycobacterium] appelbergii]|uniref:hypothetical protein n=1 Tax=[Mycobacterium] appelbergii TaxID=2939269 RepID=UPI002938D864|nr:hypothetical protein [Mycobacterium sp. 21AC1]